jgi:hypothetical protein
MQQLRPEDRRSLITLTLMAQKAFSKSNIAPMAAKASRA